MVAAHTTDVRAVPLGQRALCSAPEWDAVESLIFEGGYEDAIGGEPILWLATTSSEPGVPRFKLAIEIRGIEFSGYDFDGMEPADGGEALAAGFALKATGDLYQCVLRGELPCSISESGRVRSGRVSFALDLRSEATADRAAPQNLTLRMSVAGKTYTVVDEWFESGIERLQAELPTGVQLVCCFTCLFSDYSPHGHGLVGMRCHRGAKERYLSVRSKFDYFSVPVTEDVMETYVCPEYEPRIPGTGYRG
jgi:hypothetical protein